jgi:hypothetical protein
MNRHIPYRPAISDVLIKASANSAFRAKLLNSPQEIVAAMNMAVEDAEILSGIQASSLKDYAGQVKIKLLTGY